MYSKVQDEIIHLFPNFNSCIIKVWKWMSIYPTLYNGCDYLSMLGLKLLNVNKRGPRGFVDISKQMDR